MPLASYILNWNQLSLHLDALLTLQRLSHRTKQQVYIHHNTPDTFIIVLDYDKQKFLKKK